MPLCRFALLLVAFVVATSPVFADPSVRVRVLDRERPTSVVFQPAHGHADVLIDGRVVVTVATGGSAALETDGAGVLVRTSAGVERGRTATLRPHDGALLRVNGGSVSRTYRGSFDVTTDQTGSRPALSLVNVVGLEEYVMSVVPAEYPFPEMEGARAQAVLARTYALRSRGRYGTYDLVDHVTSQVYRGVETETEISRQAVATTRGEVLTFRGELVNAVYHSTSGGHTADNESIWEGTPMPYLRGRPDPYDSASPLHRWSETVDRDRLLNVLSRHYGTAVTGISVGRTSPEGRVTTIRLHGARERTEQANRFRLLVNDLLGRQVLKSTFFELERRGNRYVFTGRGFGHGVGMSQYGAREQAQRGRSYREILGFYYTGVTLEVRESEFRLPAPEIEPEVLLADRPEEVAPPERMEPRPPMAPTAPEAIESRLRRAGW
jgi:stage II sporulation protein D